MRFIKYFECIFNDGNGDQKIDLTNITKERAEELKGKIFCDGTNMEGELCKAPLTPANNSYDGGKTVHFRARNELHIDHCIHKDIKTKGGKRGTSTIKDGYYTREQINNFVRELDLRVNNPPKIKKPTGERKPITRKIVTDEEDEVDSRGIVKGGTIIAGNVEDGRKGRMKTRYQVTEDDIGSEVGIHGTIKKFDINKYGEVSIIFSESRYENIEVKIGQIYKNNNEQEFSKLSVVKRYIEHLSSSQTVRFVAAGLVTKYNNNLVVELQTDYSFRINGKSILDIIRIRF